VQRTLLELVNKGYLYSRRGSGSFIAPHALRNTSKLVSFLAACLHEEGALPLVIGGAETFGIGVP
jgi:DNA-binding GntR family transcriptional regulator